MKYMVTGARGQLGADVCARFAELSLPYEGVDVCKGDTPAQGTARTLAALERYSPDCVVHCAAYTNVDRAETDGEVCRLINVDLTREIARYCGRGGAKMLYISTDYVFPGDGETPYEVGDEKKPANVYGQSKLDGEQAVCQYAENHFIVRTSWLFGGDRDCPSPSFVKTMLRLGAERESVTVVCDQVGSPTYSRDLARLVCDMAQTQKYGVYHAVSQGYCAWSEFASVIMEEAGLACRVIPIPTCEYRASAARRPLNSRLSTQSLADAGFARMPAWRDALRRYLRERLLAQ